MLYYRMLVTFSPPFNPYSLSGEALQYRPLGCHPRGTCTLAPVTDFHESEQTI